MKSIEELHEDPAIIAIVRRAYREQIAIRREAAERMSEIAGQPLSGGEVAGLMAMIEPFDRSN